MTLPFSHKMYYTIFILLHLALFTSQYILEVFPYLNIGDTLFPFRDALYAIVNIL